MFLDSVEGILSENSRLLGQNEKIFRKASLLKLALVLRFLNRKRMEMERFRFHRSSFCFYAPKIV